MKDTKKISLDIFIKNNLKKNPIKKKKKELLLKRLEGTITIQQIDLYDLEEINAMVDVEDTKKTIADNINEAIQVVKYGLVEPKIDDKVIKALGGVVFEDTIKLMFTDKEILGISKEIVEFSNLTGDIENVGL